MYYVSEFGNWSLSSPFTVTIDGALILAEKRSKHPMPGTDGVYEKWAVWERKPSEAPGMSGVMQIHVRAIALMGKAKWVERCGNHHPKSCDCAGTGWKETGQDRG